MPTETYPLDADAILAALFEGEAIREETYATVACALIAIQAKHWLGADYQRECCDHAIHEGVVFA